MTLDKPLDSIPDTRPDSLDIAEAAARLGISAETVRKRLQRGRLQGHKAADGTWRVVLPPQDKPQDKAPDTPQDKPGQGDALLVQALRDEISFLRSQLQARDQEIHRAHVLLQASQQQVLALSGPQRRPWWRRLLGRG